MMITINIIIWNRTVKKKILKSIIWNTEKKIKIKELKYKEKNKSSELKIVIGKKKKTTGTYKHIPSMKMFPAKLQQIFSIKRKKEG